MATAPDTPATKRSRAQALRDLEPGDTHSISKRLEISYGLNQDEFRTHVERLRGNMDGSIARVRREMAGRTYVSEVVQALTSRGDAILITVAVTRTH